MASIALDRVSIQFPLYQGGSRSLKKTLFAMARPGALTRQRNRVLVQALNAVSLAVAHGERVGLVGHNGAGKTTLLRVLAGVYEPTSGTVAVGGQVSALLDVNLGLNPDATGYENIRLRGLYLGLRPPEIRRLLPQIAEFTELGEFLHMPVRTYSAGMGARLAFAVATAITPEILLMDEWLLAGDAQFLDKAHRRITAFVDQSCILVLASHALDILARWCTKIAWLDGGRLVMFGEAQRILSRYAESRPSGAAGD
ncbi:MAG TPA: ABC transporter ATP-binding protein [Stellaceae bacterium]|nr:ABC transporter ATP-binding protein [Stellaceae bacterium]